MPILPNPRHERFAVALSEGRCACEAYETAGYKANRGNACRMKANENVQSRLRELMEANRKNSAITVESLADELEQARLKATSLNQLAASVAATREKIKLFAPSLMKVDISAPEINDDMDYEQILAAVAKERGQQAAWHLAMAFGLSPDKYGVEIEGEAIAGDISAGGGKGREIRPVPAVAKTFRQAPPQLGHSRFASEQAKPVNRRRQI